MNNYTTVVGLDVHKETIVVAVLPARGRIDRLRARHRLSKFLLRQGRVYRETKSWGTAHKVWLRTQKFEFSSLQQTFEANMRAHDETEARLEILDQQTYDLAQQPAYRMAVNCLRALKGIDTLGALTLVVEAQDFRRFGKASAFMSFTGLVGSECSSGEKVRRGSITKAGNAHIRRVLVEAAWSQRHHNVVSRELAERRKGLLGGGIGDVALFLDSAEKPPVLKIS